MNSYFIKLTRIVWVFGLMGILASCVDTIPNRSTITPGAQANKPPVCTEDQELVEETVDDEKVLTCKDKAEVRPTGAVFFKDDFCACKDSKAISLGSCAAFCSDKPTEGAEILYANFKVTEAISLNTTFNNLSGWCKNPLPTDTQNPECELQAKDSSGNVIPLDVTISGSTNALQANITNKLSNDKTYIFTLVEKISKASSDSIQFVKYSPDIGLPALGPLKNVPVSQYTCILRNSSEDDTAIYFDSAYRLHFYFVPNLPPKPIPAGNGILFCHDIWNPRYGKIDDVLYPRMELIQGVFNLWDTMDPRFYDNNGNGATDVNEAIIQKTRNFGGTIATGTNFFQKFAWPGAPNLEEESGSSTTQPLGYFMAPWIDNSTFKSYCLNSSHYNSTNPLFKAMRDILQVDTEGLYIGEKAPEAVQNQDGTTSTGLPDYILIREADLKQVWFYLKNGVPTAPDDNNVANVAVYFYYPINKTSPFVRTSTQRVYQVKSAAELNASNGNSQNDNSTSGSTNAGGTTTYPPHDRKIGCIPKF